jgi:release factor glutamine methyltransferase
MNSWTLGKVLLWASRDFGDRGIDRPRFEAEVLLAHALGLGRLDLYTGFDRPMEKRELQAYREMIVRRRQGEPVAYITGQKEFWSLDFQVDHRVLIPRPETELLVESVLERAPEGGRVLDLCTGSGCVAVALASERPELLVDAVDISADALCVAQENVARYGLKERVRLIEGDLFEPLETGIRYAVITANPPYVTSAEMATLQNEVQKEPRLALCGGDDGLDVIRRIISAAPAYLKPGGTLILEVASRQTALLLNDIGPAAFQSEGVVFQDLTGEDRVVIWQTAPGGTQ